MHRAYLIILLWVYGVRYDRLRKRSFLSSTSARHKPKTRLIWLKPVRPDQSLHFCLIVDEPIFAHSHDQSFCASTSRMVYQKI